MNVKTKQNSKTYTEGNKSSVTKGKEQGDVSGRVHSATAPSFQEMAPEGTVKVLG